MFFDKPKLKLVDYNPQKHEPQTSVEKLSDLLFILFVLREGEELNIPTTIGVLIKTLFTSKIDLADQDIEFLNIGFYPYTHGPFNQKIYNQIEELANMGLIQKNGYNINLTIKGLKSIEFKEIKTLKNFKLIHQIIEDNLKKCKNFFNTSDKLHKEKMLYNKKIITMQEAINNNYWDKYIENIKEPTTKFKLPSKTINQLFKINANVTDKDYEETRTFNNANEFLQSLGCLAT